MAALLVAAVASAGLAPASGAESDAPGLPTNLSVDQAGNVSWTQGTGPIEGHTIEWQDTRVPSAWLEESPSGAAELSFESLVVNGDPVEIAEHRYTVLLANFDEDGEFLSQCGGVVIAPGWVMTAAHCTLYQPTGTYYASPAFISVIHGLADLNDVPDDSDDHIRFTEAVYRHPGYNPGSPFDDIALLELHEPLEPANADPIPLFDLDGPTDGSAAYLTGWGATGTFNDPSADLLGLEVEIDASCGDWPEENPEVWDDDVFLCASGLPGAACDGDSGGPLVLNRSGVVMVAGVVSFRTSEGCAVSADKPDVYTRVSSYVGWIEGITGSLSSEKTVGGGATSTTIDGLRPGRTYAVTVKASNQHGIGGAVTSVTMPGTLLFTAAEIGVDCTQPQPHQLVDVLATSFAYNAVGCIFNLGVTTGTSATTYSPDDSVTREQMAAFIERLYERLTGQDCVGSHPFTDVATSSFAYAAIGCIYALEITTGLTATTYGPKDTVTREQMAAFIERLYERLTDTSCSGSHPFIDVPGSSFAFASIGCIYGLEITNGTTATTYGPSETVTRAQMAAFLERLYKLLSA